ncbi:hypothetical protein LSCM1_03486 [Leishmania martiniquensis]|uniref:Protein kinase domain-containing protein n=1 Tax=Leishmania martiniquensis TaxID=1580590 RepID=A0A836KRC3_9TRYP|nr:hypothetical protein LSCM1_03486 [Leishmania martiniquensis]
MSSSPTATHSSAFPDSTAASIALPSDDFFECPRCHRHCKSRTWFLKHLEACGKSASSTSTHGHTVSGEGSHGSSDAVAFAMMVNHHRHLSRSSATEDVTPPLIESVASTTSSSLNTSYSRVHSQRTPRLAQAIGNADREGAPSVSIDAVATTSAGLLRSSAAGLNGPGDGRGGSHPTTPAAAARAPPHHLIDSLATAGSASGVAAGGSIVANGASKPASPSQGNAAQFASPRGLRASASCGEFGSDHASIGLAPASAPAAASPCSSDHVGRRDEAQQHRQPDTQESFRLQSDFTWTQYTPNSSEEEDAVSEHAGSILEHASPLLLRSLGRVQESSCPAVRKSADSSCNTGAERCMPPRDSGRAADKGARERGSIRKSNSHRNGSPGAAVDVGCHVAAGKLHAGRLPREDAREVPQLLSGPITELSPLERNAGSASDGWQSAWSGANSDRFHRSARDSASANTFSRVLSSASPTLAPAMASPSVLQTNISPSGTQAAGSSVSRLSGLNCSSNGGGGRTPRHGDRSGAATPRTISFQRGRAVGSGGFGTVYQVILSDGSLAAVKELKLENANLKAIDREVRAMSSIPPHANCVRYLGSRYSAHHYYIIMEYISGGSINSLRKSVGRFRESVFQRYAYMVLLGLSHLHANGIVHRDIKGANVLLDESGCAKIVDFGCSSDRNQATTTLSGGGTPLWMAPEVCRGEPATEKSDVWAYGCLCLEMTNETGVPWNFPPGMTLQGVVYALACAKSPPAIPADLSPEAQDFLQRCLRIDPEERATVTELLQHPFFDMDLVGDSEEDELMSSYGASVRQSAVKRAVRQMNRGNASDATAQQPPLQDERADMGEGAGGARGVPLKQESVGSSLSPRGDHSGEPGRTLDADVGALSRSTISQSKSPSGPQLDHYTQSVNAGFSLQAVDEDDDGGGVGAGKVKDNAGSSPSVLGGSNPAATQTAVSANRCHTPYSYAGVEEDEHEYAQMITEIITQAREAYTDEERRMTERRRRLNMMYPSSDEDSSDTTTTTSGGSQTSKNGDGGDGSHGGCSAEEDEESQHGDIESDLSTTSSSDGYDGVNGRSLGGPRRHSLGATWGAQSARLLATAEKTEEPKSAVDHVTLQKPAFAVQATASLATAVPASSAFSGRLPRSGALPSSAVAVTSPGSVHVDSADTSLSPYRTTTSSGTPGVEAGPQSVRSPQGVSLHPSFASSYPPRQRRPCSISPPAHLRGVVGKDLRRDGSRSRSSGSFRKATCGSVVATATGGVTPAPREPGGPVRVPTPIHQPAASSPSSPHALAGAGIPPPLPSAPAAQQSPVGGDAVLSDRSSSSHTPLLTPSLTVGGPRRQATSQQPAAAAMPPSAQADHPGSPTKFYGSDSDRPDVSSAISETGVTDHLSKGLSVAQQKGMHEMSDWGARSDRRHKLSSLSPDIGRCGSSASSAATGSAICGGDAHHTHYCLHHRSSGHDEDLDSECTSEAESLSRRAPTGLSATETVAAAQEPQKRKLWGLGIFRSLRSK